MMYESSIRRGQCSSIVSLIHDIFERNTIMTNLATPAQTNDLLAHCLTQLRTHPKLATSSELSRAQNTLLVYLRLDRIAEDEGLVALIAQGWGDVLLAEEWAQQLDDWGIPMLPEWWRKARDLYLLHGAEIAQRASDEPEILRAAFGQFAPLDEQYFFECEDIFPKIYRYVRGHYADFAGLLDFQTA